MDEEKFHRFQLFLINLYAKILKIFGSKKTTVEIALDYVIKYATSIRKINDVIRNNLNKIQKLLKKCAKLKR